MLCPLLKLHADHKDGILLWLYSDMWFADNCIIIIILSNYNLSCVISLVQTQQCVCGMGDLTLKGLTSPNPKVWWQDLHLDWNNWPGFRQPHLLILVSPITNSYSYGLSSVPITHSYSYGLSPVPITVSLYIIMCVCVCVCLCSYVNVCEFVYMYMYIRNESMCICVLYVCLYVCIQCTCCVYLSLCVCLFMCV